MQANFQIERPTEFHQLIKGKWATEPTEVDIQPMELGDITMVPCYSLDAQRVERRYGYIATQWLGALDTGTPMVPLWQLTVTHPMEREGSDYAAALSTAMAAYDFYNTTFGKAASVMPAPGWTPTADIKEWMPVSLHILPMNEAWGETETGLLEADGFYPFWPYWAEGELPTNRTARHIRLTIDGFAAMEFSVFLYGGLTQPTVHWMAMALEHCWRRANAEGPML